MLTKNNIPRLSNSDYENLLLDDILFYASRRLLRKELRKGDILKKSQR